MDNNNYRDQINKTDANDFTEIEMITAKIRESVNKYATDILFHNQELGKTHNPYDQEIRMLYSIETGNVELLNISQQEATPEALGITAKDPVRSGKNSAQYVIFAAARAAIRGGLPAEYALTLTDAYSQKIEELTDLSLLESLVQNVLTTLTNLVHQLKTASSLAEKDTETDFIPVIERCKNYIFKHMHEKLTVQQIAGNLGIHPNYLSSLFTSYEGISLLQYILREKVNLAKNMLIYSDYSYIEIANYLGFSSQSHLGVQFKKFTGMTLKQFKDKYHKKDF